MAKNDKRPIIKLKSTAGTGYTWAASVIRWGPA